MRVPLGAWAPDQVGLGVESLDEALNVLPRADGYDAFPDVQVIGSSVTASAMLTGYSTRDLTGNGYTFAASNDHIYRQSATGTWEAVNRTASYGSGVMRLTTYGNAVLGVNGVDAMQVYTLGTSTQFRDQSASASAPIAAHICTVRDFVFTGREPSALNRVRWCQIDNPLRWGRSQAFQSDLQDCPGDGGNIVGMTGGDFCVVLTDRSLHRFSYIGAPYVFRRDELAPNTGCIASGSIARYQALTFFLSGNGFMVFDGNQAYSIGNEFIDDWFFDNADAGYYDRMSAAIDPNRKLYFVSFTSTNATGGTPDRILVYNFESKRWTNATQVLDVLFSGISRGAYTLEQLDAFGTMDTLPYSLDSDQWGGSKQNVLAGFDSGHRLVTFDATTFKTATLITGNAQFNQDQRSWITELRPLVDGSSSTAITAMIGGRDRLIDTATFTGAVSMNALGTIPFRSNYRYQKLRLDITGGFERAFGIDVRLKKIGRR